MVLTLDDKRNIRLLRIQIKSLEARATSDLEKSKKLRKQLIELKSKNEEKVSIN